MADAICTIDGCEKRQKQYGHRVCSMHAERKRTTGSYGPAHQLIPFRLDSATCYFDGCNKPRSNSRLCAMHSARKSRHGDPTIVNTRTARPRMVVASTGYIKVHLRGHPLAERSSDYVYEHRAVLYAAIGSGPQQCAWCRRSIWWVTEDRQARLEVDHFNGIRSDNHVANLLPSCHACNAGRVYAHRADQPA